MTTRRPVLTKGAESAQKSPSLARAVEEVMSKETDETWFMSFVKSWRLTLELDSDHTCSFLDLRRWVPFFHRNGPWLIATKWPKQFAGTTLADFFREDWPLLDCNIKPDRYSSFHYPDTNSIDLIQPNQAHSPSLFSTSLDNKKGRESGCLTCII